MYSTFPRRRVARVYAPLLPLAVLLLVSLWTPISKLASAADDDSLAGIPKAEYRARRQQLMSRIKDGVVVMIGAREDEFGEVGRFRQKNDFMYLTGVETPGAYLMLVPAGVISGRPAQETLFIPPRNRYQEKWTGPQIGPGAEGEAAFGIQRVGDLTKVKDEINALLSLPAFAGANGNGLKLYTIVPHDSTADIERETGFIASLKQSHPALQVVDVQPILAEMRKIKSAAEIALLQKAIDITGEGQRDANAVIRPGAFEYEVQAALEAAFTRNGAERPGFPSIVGSGIYSTVLHYNQNHKRIESDDLVVVDIGAEFSYFTADITRTYPASEKFTPRQREIYQLVLDAQRAAEKAFKPGKTTIAQLNRVAIDTMKASPLRDKNGKTLDPYFIHGLGHWLGMDVHDVGLYTNMPVGAVFTIEPGIYIPEEKLGVRIEDDYLVTESGLVKLSRAIPSDPDEIERLMAARPRGGAAAPASRN